MKALRTLASAVCIVIGALLIATWAASTAALSAIEDGTVIEDATARAVTTELAQEALVQQGTDKVLTALANTGFNTDIIGFKKLVSGVVNGVVSSETFAATVHAQAKSIREQMVAQLNSAGEGPISVTLDFSDQVNNKLGAIPVVGDSLPTIAVPGLPVEVMDQGAADKARATWTWMKRAEHWFGWLGLAFLTLGILVSYRKRWFFAKVFLAVGVMSSVIWLAMTYLDPQQVADHLPGEGVADAIVVEIAKQASNSVANAMGWVALGAMIGALVLFLLASRTTKGGRT